MSVDTPAQEKPPLDLKVLWTRCALFAAVVGVVGSLHLYLSMGLNPCPLCYYQRAFIMAVVGVLAFEVFLPGMSSTMLTIFALPSAVAGGAIAVFHVYLEVTGVLECPKGMTTVLTAPQESLLVFLLVNGLLVGSLFHHKTHVPQGLGAMLLGVVLCVACVKSTPMASAPTAPYPANEELKGCRPMYHPPG